jgi:hypothetical protein
MAKISITIEGSTVGTITVSDTLTQEHSDRFMAWLAATYGRNEAGEQRPPAEMIAACWAAIRSGVFANIEAWEGDVAAQAARNAVPPMASTTTVA